ncbi:MAG: hypothetical protein U0414_44355 [Polyangiaceae bacterium]
MRSPTVTWSVPSVRSSSSVALLPAILEDDDDRGRAVRDRVTVPPLPFHMIASA